MNGPEAVRRSINSFCAVLSTGHVDCWGYNGYGQLGNGTTTNSDVPGRGPGPELISGGSRHRRRSSARDLHETLGLIHRDPLSTLKPTRVARAAMTEAAAVRLNQRPTA